MKIFGKIFRVAHCRSQEIEELQKENQDFEQRLLKLEQKMEGGN